MNYHEIEYRKRINKVLAFIDDHFNEALPLGRLAGVAGFSPFHFHRIFQSFTGESLHEYIKRIRLGKAAHQLYIQMARQLLMSLWIADLHLHPPLQGLSRRYTR